MVQLPQLSIARRPPTADAPCSRRAAPLIPFVSIERPICAAALKGAGGFFLFRLLYAGRLGNSLGGFLPPTSFRLPRRSSDPLPSRTSVRARSNPVLAFGPAFIETQKHVLPACPQFNGDNEARSPEIAL